MTKPNQFKLNLNINPTRLQSLRTSAASGKLHFRLNLGWHGVANLSVRGNFVPNFGLPRGVLREIAIGSLTSRF